MTVYKAIIKFFVDNPWFTVFGACTLIQVTPIKINPWSWLLKQVRKLFLGDLEKDVQEIKKDVLNNKIEATRWSILDFANSSLQGRRHTKEEWNHCIDQLAWYDDICEQRKITNGVIEECASYLRSSYQEHMHKNDFL